METKPLTNALIKEFTTDAMMFRGYLRGSFNQALAAGYYWVTPGQGATDYPVGAYAYGILEVYPAGDFLLQRYTTHASGSGLLYPSIYERMRYKTSFTVWVKVTASPIS